MGEFKLPGVGAIRHREPLLRGDLPFSTWKMFILITVPFRLSVADDYCRERPRAVPFVCGG